MSDNADGDDFDDADHFDPRLGVHWNGNLAAPSSNFATDGHSMLLKEAVQPWAMPLLAIHYWSAQRPIVPSETCRDIFDKGVAAAVVPCRFGGCRSHGPEYWLLELLRDDGIESWVSPYIATFVMGVLSPDELRQARDPLASIALCRAGRPVGIVMPVKRTAESVGERFAWPTPSTPEGATPQP